MTTQERQALAYQVGQQIIAQQRSLEELKKIKAALDSHDLPPDKPATPPDTRTAAQKEQIARLMRPSENQ